MILLIMYSYSNHFGGRRVRRYTAEDGLSALAQIERSHPHLVLLDVIPGMDGFEVTQRIRQHTKLSFIPILLITAYDQPSVVQGLDMGEMILSANPLKSMNCWRGCEHSSGLSVDERDKLLANEKILFPLTHDLRTLIAADRMLMLFQALGELSPTMQVIATMARSNQNLQMVNTGGLPL